MKNLFFLAVMACFAGTAKSANYYFSSSRGDDSRSSAAAQSPATPWRTLDRLNAFFWNLKPGDSILFQRGDTFYGSIVTTVSGTASSPLVFSAFGTGAQPVISGFTTVRDWTARGNGIYESNVLPTGTDVKVVTMNGQDYAMGRFPNANDASGGYLTFEAQGPNTLTDKELPSFPDWTGAQLVVRTSRYTLEKAEISAMSGGTLQYAGSFAYLPVEGYGYFIQNDIRTLDQPGEWYYNPATKRLAVYFGTALPQAYTVQVASVDVLVNAQASHLVFNDLSFEGANTYGIFNDWGGMKNLQVKNCSLSFMGVNAISLAGRSDFLLENSSIRQVHNNGVFLYTASVNPVVRNCVFTNTGTFPGMLGDPHVSGNAIYSTAGGLTAQNNRISQTGYQGILFGGSSVLVENNYIDSFCTVLDDGGGIYTYTGGLSGPFTNRKIIGNIVLNGLGAPQGTPEPYIPAQGIYLDDNTANVDILNNTVANCAYAGIFLHNARNFSILNNILYNNTYQIGTQHDSKGSSITGGSILLNQLFSLHPGQLIYHMGSSENDFGNMGRIDSNYYCRPLDENNIIHTNWYANQEADYDLSRWQNSYAKDVNSRKTPLAISDTSAVRFEYNATAVSRTVLLEQPYSGLDSRVYTGRVELPPFSSVILLKTEVLPVDSTYFRDADGDGFGNAADSILAIRRPAGYVTLKGDCNDGDAAIFPGAGERCGNGIDDNCNGQVDENCLVNASDTLLPFGESWNYLDNGTNQKTVWRNPSFSDAGWETGTGSFGYGAGNNSTPLRYGSNARKRYITTYFRKTISLARAAAYAGFSATVNSTAGFVVYVNGAEVYRSNLPQGSIRYTTLALEDTRSGPATYHFSIDSRFFKEGSNVIAVEAHLHRSASPDLSFDLQLAGDYARAAMAAQPAGGKPVPLLKETANVTRIVVWPNPTTRYFTIGQPDGHQQMLTVTLYDLGGRRLEVHKGSTVQAGGSLPPGVYMVEVVQGKQSKTFKVLKTAP